MWSIIKLPKPENKLNRIAFCGPMASGKSYLADFLVTELQYEKFSFAAKLKSLAYELYGVQSKTGEARQLLQRLGAQLRENDPEVWIKYAIAQMAKRIENNKLKFIVLDDLRYLNEAQHLKASGFFIIKVTTPDDIRRERVARLYPDTKFDEASTHDSEKEWLDIEADYTLSSVDANSLVELKELIYNGKYSIYK